MSKENKMKIKWETKIPGYGPRYYIGSIGHGVIIFTISRSLAGTKEFMIHCRLPNVNDVNKYKSENDCFIQCEKIFNKWLQLTNLYHKEAEHGETKEMSHEE